uniref:Heterogeneous nuclear ribonucleoproteins A1 n=1 Tax=Anthurium amnicola TaxID=1678845 RepID=A0A1D1ZI12_9ARAE
MDLSNKKRKADENGVTDGTISPTSLTPADARKIIESFSKEQLLDIVQEAACRHADVLDAVRANADHDPAQRKLFIRGLGWDTTTEGLRSLFSTYGELAEAIVVVDKATGKSKGFGFITFRHIDGALLALKEPSKKIDGRMTVTQLAASGIAGPAAPHPPAVDASLRKIYVGNVPHDMPADRLLAHFLSYGEIEEGPLGFDKQTGKSRGFALFVYKTAEGARASLVDPTKVIDGHTMVCKLAADGKKGTGASGAAPPVGGVPNQLPIGAGAGAVAGDGLGMGAQPALQGSMPGQFVPYRGFSSFGGFSTGLQAPAGFAQHHALNPPMPSSVGMGVGMPGLTSVGGQVSSSLGAGGAATGYVGLSSVGGQVPSSLGGGGASGYGGALGGPYGTSQYGAPGAGGYGGLGVGSSLYRLPPTSVGTTSGGFPEGGHYGLTSSSYLPTGSSPGHRVPSYPSLPQSY